MVTCSPWAHPSPALAPGSAQSHGSAPSREALHFLSELGKFHVFSPSWEHFMSSLPAGNIPSFLSLSWERPMFSLQAMLLLLWVDVTLTPCTAAGKE